MKKIYLFTLLAAALGFTSCSIEKRHYMNGYHVTWNHKAPTSTHTGTESTAVVAIDEATADEVISETPGSTHQMIPVTGPTNHILLNPAPSKSAVQRPESISPELNNNGVRKEAKQIIRQKPVNADLPSTPDDTSKVLLVILAILIPPVAMWLYEGSWNGRCWVNLLLTLLCVLPGVIHALVIIIGDK